MLEVTSLCKQYAALRSVNNVSFTIGDGETVGLLGRNGAGKSTMMRMLAGYLTPTSGEIRLWGHSMLEDPLAAKRCVGYLPELPPLYADMTVNEHLEFVCSLRGVPARQMKKECARVCGELSLSHVSGRVIGHLSKGYRQRVGFAAALIGEPKLLILDEPTVGLDPQQMIEIRRLIRRFSGQMSILISSHVLSEIAAVCSRLLILRRGTLVADGTPEEIERAHAGSGAVTVVVSGDVERAQRALQACGAACLQREGEGRVRFTLEGAGQDDGRVFRALCACGDAIAVHELRPVVPSLEDIFVSITQEGETDDEGRHS